MLSRSSGELFISLYMEKTLRLIYRHQDTLVRLNIAPNGIIHSFSFISWYPYLMTLCTGLNTDIFEKIEFLFYKAVNEDFSITELPPTDSTQVVFHVRFSLLVFGSSHLTGSSQCTVII